MTSHLVAYLVVALFIIQVFVRVFWHWIVVLVPEYPQPEHSQGYRPMLGPVPDGYDAPLAHIQIHLLLNLGVNKLLDGFLYCRLILHYDELIL